MKNINNLSFNKKTALVRCDFNVSFSDKQEILDDYRIKTSIVTIKYLINENAKVVIINHFTKVKDPKKTFRLVQARFEQLLNKKVVLIKNFKDKKKIDRGSGGDVFLLMNIRDFQGEENNDPFLAQQLSSLGDIYVNDAFSVCHRKHASVYEIARIMPCCAGFQLMKETKVLSKSIKDPWRPLVVIVGGAKVSSKVNVLVNFLQLADHLIMGGKLVNKILEVKGMIPKADPINKELFEKINKIDLTSTKVHFPVDVITATNNKKDYNTRVTGLGKVKKEEDIFDIGPETIDIYTKIIKEARMIIWAGPLGFFEENKFENGTKEISRAISMNHQAFKIVGGGDTGVAITKFGYREAIDHISTGGGAMLEFISGNKLPGLEALNYYQD